MAGEFNADPDDARFNWQPEAEGEAPAEAEPEAPEAPTLDDLDDETRAKVEAYQAHQEAARRQTLQEYGLDLAADGQPVIRDPNRFAAWSGLATPSRQPAANPPPPIAPTPASPEEEPISLDPLAMTGAELQAAIDKMVQKQIAPLVQQNQELRGQLQRRSAREAMAGVRQALEQYAPEIAGITEHPEFAEQYRLQAEAMDPRALEDPRLVAAMAAGLRPYLQSSPNTPPGWSPQPRPPAPEQPRDTQGRFTEVARNMANRSNIGQVPQARGGMAPPAPREAAARETQQFLDTFKEYAQGRVSKKAVGPTDADASEYSDYAEWQEAMKANGGGGRR